MAYSCTSVIILKTYTLFFYKNKDESFFIFISKVDIVEYFIFFADLWCFILQITLLSIQMLYFTDLPPPSCEAR